MNEIVYNLIECFVYAGLPIILLSYITLDDLLGDRFMHFGENRYSFREKYRSVYNKNELSSGK